MTPNENFKLRYPAIWEQYYGKPFIPEYQINCGLYSLYLGIGFQTKLYPLLQQVYPIQTANAIMDFSMYVLNSGRNVAQLFEEEMKRQMVFSAKIRSDTWFSKLFTEAMNEDSNHDFRIGWLNQCKLTVKEVWICIDGSNNDCVADSELCQKGEAKSKKNVTIITYMYAVSAVDGLPVTYFVSEGNKVDSKAFMKLCHFLSENGMQIKGVILDKGFLTHDCLNLIIQSNFDYVIMLKSDTYAHQNMLDNYSAEMFWNPEYAVTPTLSGITSTEPIKIFKEYDDKGYIHLFFDGENACGRYLTLQRKVWEARNTAEINIKAGKKATIPKELKKYLQIEVNEKGEQTGVITDYETWKKDCRRKGYYSICTSHKVSTQEADFLYNLRDKSEVGYMIVKSMLGFDVTRGHSTENIQNRMFVCFITSIIRNRFMVACQKFGYDTNLMLKETNNISLTRMHGDIYAASDDMLKRDLDVLKVYGIKKTDFSIIADEYNHRLYDNVITQYRYMPEVTKTKLTPGRGRPKKNKTESPSQTDTVDKTDVKPDESKEAIPHSNRGRKKGSKNKKTLEREAEQARIEAERIAQGLGPTPAPKRGRKPGSKNKKTLEREAEQARIEAERIAQGLGPTPAPKRGRKPGSKNKKTLEREAEQAKMDTE